MKNLISIFMIIITIISATSCKGTKREIEKLAVVLAAGFDLTPEGEYLLTVQILNPEKDSSGKMGTKKGEGQQITTDALVYSETGDTPFDAINHLSLELSRPLFFDHSKISIIGEDLAEAGLALYIDSALRGYTTRPDIPLFVTKGMASSIISAVTADEKIPANAIAGLVKQQSIIGYAPVVTRMDFANALASKTAAPILGVINLNKTQYISETFKIEGTAVFKKDKLIGYLDINETRGMQWVKGKVKTGNIVTLSQDDEIRTFEILTAKSKVKPIIKNDSVMIEVNIKEVGNIREMPGKLDPMDDPKIMDVLTKLQNEAIEKEVKLALYAAQKELNADIFDFGGTIHKTYPEVWKKIEQNWEDIFPNIKVDVKVNSSLERPGIISKPMK